MPYKWSLLLWLHAEITWITETWTYTSGFTPCALSVGTVSYIQHMSFIYSSKQQCLVKNRCFRGQRGTYWWVCKAWLAVLDRRRNLNRASQVKEQGKGTVVWVLDPLLCCFSWPFHRSPSLSSHLHFFSSPSVFLFYSLCASARLMYCICACWIAASEYTHEGLLGFRSCVATVAVPLRMSPSSLPHSRNFCLEGRDKHIDICLTLSELLGNPGFAY